MADSLGTRIKSYEAASDHVLPPRLPVILRLDGNSFSKFTRVAGFSKPFDVRFDNGMNEAAKAVLEYTHGLLAYVQSDEITVLLRNDQTHDTTPFLANRIQKICSIAASVCSTRFYWAMLAGDCLSFAADPPVFDCRAFVVPPSDVNNVFLWRQWDAFKNCVGAYAHWEVGKVRGQKVVDREIHGLSVKERQEYIFQHLGVNVNDLPSAWRRGRCLRRVVFQAPIEEVVAPDVLTKLLATGKATPGQVVTRSEYRVDAEIPLFHEDHAYVEDLLLDRKEETASV